MLGRATQRAGRLIKRGGQVIDSVWRTALCESLRRATPIILTISAITLGMGYLGWLDRFENAGLDAFNILKAPLEPSHVVLIGITDDDYRDYFGETSPLEPEKLQAALEAIALGNPRVIAVDLDTSAAIFGRLNIPEHWPPIVWAQDAVPVGDVLSPIPALAGLGIRSIDAVGVAALPQDFDGVVRRYKRYFLSSKGNADSFPWSIVRVACGSGLKEFCTAADDSHGHSPKGLRLNFSGERYNFSPLSIQRVIQAAQSEGWHSQGPLRNKVVLFGGCFRAARDSYVTPVGTMYGMQLMAQAVESEFGGGIRPSHHLIEMSLDVGAGMILVLIHHFFFPPLALALSLVAIPVLSFCGSYLTFATLARWLNFVPVVVGVLIHQLYDHAREYYRMRKELELAKSKTPTGK